MKNWMKNVLLTVGSIAVSLGGVELALRLYGDEVLAMGNQFLFYQFDEKLGWGNAPGTEGWFARSEYRHHITINSLGMRDREPIPDAPGLRRVAVLGDSFVWGVGADYGERFTEALENGIPNLDVLNYGVSGYGTTQHLAQLDSVLARNPDFVVLAICLSNDVMEAVSSFRSDYNKPFAKRGAGGVVEIAGYPLVNTRAMGVELLGGQSELRLWRLVNAIRMWSAPPPAARSDPRFDTGFTIGDSDIYTADDKLSPEKLRQKREALDIEADLAAQIRERVEARLGAGRFLVAFVPTKADIIPSSHKADEMGDQLLSRLRARNVEVVDARASFAASDFWKRDGHWNPDGHKKFADLLAPRLANLTVSKRGN